MIDQSLRVNAAEEVCRLWHRSSVPFVVMHGLEGYPASLGRDLDILMRPRDARTALPSAAALLRELGWDITVCPPRLWGHRLVALRESGQGELGYLEFHTMRSLRWATMTLAEAIEPTDRVGCFPVSSWATFAKSVVTPSLAGDTARFDPQYLRGLQKAAGDSTIDRMSYYFGEELAQDIVEAVVRQDDGELRRVAPQLRKAGLSWIYRHPVAGLSASPSFFYQKLGRFVSRTGCRVHIDISKDLDRGTIVQHICGQLGEVFPRVSVSRSRSPAESIRQQYRTLSRQGVVLQLAEAQEEGNSTVTAKLLSPRGGSRGPTELEIETTQGDEELAARRISRWIVDQWSSRFRCEPS